MLGEIKRIFSRKQCYEVNPENKPQQKYSKRYINTTKAKQHLSEQHLLESIITDSVATDNVFLRKVKKSDDNHSYINSGGNVSSDSVNNHLYSVINEKLENNSANISQSKELKTNCNEYENLNNYNFSESDLEAVSDIEPKASSDDHIYYIIKHIRKNRNTNTEVTSPNNQKIYQNSDHDACYNKDKGNCNEKKNLTKPNISNQEPQYQNLIQMIQKNLNNNNFRESDLEGVSFIEPKASSDDSTYYIIMHISKNRNTNAEVTSPNNQKIDQNSDHDACYNKDKGNCNEYKNLTKPNISNQESQYQNLIQMVQKNLNNNNFSESDLEAVSFIEPKASSDDPTYYIIMHTSKNRNTNTEVITPNNQKIDQNSGHDAYYNEATNNEKTIDDYITLSDVIKQNLARGYL